MMNSVEYFLKEYHYHILTSVVNTKASEYVCVGDGEYKKLVLPDNPFILKSGNGINLIHNSHDRQKIEFYFPLISPASQYQMMSFEEYKYCRDNQIAVRYLRISDSDRLKFSGWVRAERNIRYDVFSYEDLSLFSKRCTFQKRTVSKRSTAK